MILEKFTVQSCCGKASTIYKIDRPIDMNLLNSIAELGFTELKHFTKAGILYLDNSNFIITGPIGSNRLQLKCKKSNCNQEEVELLLKNIK